MHSPSRGGRRKGGVPAALARLHIDELEGDVTSIEFHTTRHGAHWGNGAAAAAGSSRWWYVFMAIFVLCVLYTFSPGLNVVFLNGTSKGAAAAAGARAGRRGWWYAFSAGDGSSNGGKDNKDGGAAGVAGSVIATAHATNPPPPPPSPPLAAAPSDTSARSVLNNM